MTDIRRPTPTGNLNLPTVGDFTVSYEFSDGSDFPSAAELYFLIGRASGPQTRWDFTINGGVATLKIESEAVAQVKPQTPFWLMLGDLSTSPSTELEILTGRVK
ncbi:DUF7264 domain-containing protein, partial [Rhodococcus rhodnii]